MRTIPAALRDRRKFRIGVRVNGKTFGRQRFDTLEEARTAVRQLRAELHQEYARHG